MSCTELIFQKNFKSESEYLNFIGPFESLCENREPGFSPLFIPIRTDNLANFSKDFFLPSFVNIALKTDDFATKVILCILFPIIDILTLGIRVITVIPRYYYNKALSKENHPLYKYLIRNNVNKELLSSNQLVIEELLFARTANHTYTVNARYQSINLIESPTLCYLRGASETEGLTTEEASDILSDQANVIDDNGLRIEVV